MITLLNQSEPKELWIDPDDERVRYWQQRAGKAWLPRYLLAGPVEAESEALRAEIADLRSQLAKAKAYYRAKNPDGAIGRRSREVKMLKEFLYGMFLNFMAYCGVLVAMVWGWGLWPVSWLWVIVGYTASSLTWPFIVFFRIRMTAAIKGGEE